MAQAFVRGNPLSKGALRPVPLIFGHLGGTPTFCVYVSTYMDVYVSTYVGMYYVRKYVCGCVRKYVCGCVLCTGM